MGVIQFGMYFLQLGFVTDYLSEPMVNAFLAGSSLHVATSQLKLLFGFKLASYSGVFKVPKVTFEERHSINAWLAYVLFIRPGSMPYLKYPKYMCLQWSFQSYQCQY